jgi:hypothetical protein
MIKICGLHGLHTTTSIPLPLPYLSKVISFIRHYPSLITSLHSTLPFHHISDNSRTSHRKRNRLTNKQSINLNEAFLHVCRTREAVWSATKLQTWVRMLQAEYKVWNPKSGLAIILNSESKEIQRMVRGAFGRRQGAKRRKHRRENKACLKIQASLRGKLGRVVADAKQVQVTILREQERVARLKQDKREAQASTRIQCLARRIAAGTFKMKLESEKLRREEEERERLRLELLEQ